jgi:RNA polymerase sigma-70 factor (ECF subfamily)
MSKSQTPQPINDGQFELVREIVGGRVDRFEELVGLYEKRLYNFGLRMCGDASDAEDLVQESFLNIFRYLKNFRYETRLKNWIYRIATSVCLKKRRRSKFAPEKELPLEDFLPDKTAQTAATPRWASLPIDQVLDRELAQVMKEAVVDLPKKYRLVFLLRDVEGFSTQETGDILNITPANVKVRLHRARLFLRDKLEDYFKYDG